MPTLKVAIIIIGIACLVAEGLKTYLGNPPRAGLQWIGFGILAAGVFLA